MDCNTFYLAQVLVKKRQRLWINRSYATQYESYSIPCYDLTSFTYLDSKCGRSIHAGHADIGKKGCYDMAYTNYCQVPGTSGRLHLDKGVAQAWKKKRGGGDD